MRLASAALGLAACQPASGPTIDRVEPARAARGAMVTVHGSDFCGEGRAAGDGTCATLPPGYVVFGIELPMARASVVTWSDVSIGVEVPAAAMTGEVAVVVTVDGRSSNSGGFEVLP